MVSRSVPWTEEAAKFRGESSDSEAESSGKSPGKSAITNGTRWLVGVDGRNPWARRCREVARAFVVDLGGKENASAAQLVLARRAAEEHGDELAPRHSITSSARSRTASGILSPSALAVVRLMTKSNLVGCSTGMSAGFAPRRILSTRSAARRNRSGKFAP